MRGKTWDAANDRTLLLQIIALKNVKMTGQDWDFIAGKWNDGTKKDAFRKHFQSIRAEADHLIGVVPATGETKGIHSPFCKVVWFCNSRLGFCVLTG